MSSLNFKNKLCASLIFRHLLSECSFWSGLHCALQLIILNSMDRSNLNFAHIWTLIFIHESSSYAALKWCIVRDCISSENGILQVNATCSANASYFCKFRISTEFGNISSICTRSFEMNEYSSIPVPQLCKSRNWNAAKFGVIEISKLGS